jgi:hypothetical protein
MYPSYTQFPQHQGGQSGNPSTPLKKIGGASNGAYTEVNQLLDMQLKQAKLRKLNNEQNNF